MIQRRLEAPPVRSRRLKPKTIDVSPLVRKFGAEKARAAAKASVLAQMTQCDRCRFRGLPDELREHKQTAHRERNAAFIPELVDAQPPNRTPRSNPKKRRPKVTRQLPSSDKHAKRSKEQSCDHVWTDDRHRKQAVARGFIKPAGKAKTVGVKAVSRSEVERLRAAVLVPLPGRKGSVRCPRCHSSVKATKFARHLRRIHGIEDTQQTKEASTKSGRKIRKAPSRQRREPRDYIHDPQIVDEREAHRQVGFVVRENGRYGSHPLHDRFDDESEP